MIFPKPRLDDSFQCPYHFPAMLLLAQLFALASRREDRDTASQLGMKMEKHEKPILYIYTVCVYIYTVYIYTIYIYTDIRPKRCRRSTKSGCELVDFCCSTISMFLSFLCIFFWGCYVVNWECDPHGGPRHSWANSAGLQNWIDQM